jgi:O-acetylhomoserine/O-acetylserine sulfhydrylase-like pyridoxal-dependent enzyme
VADRFQERLAKLEEMHAAIAVARGAVDQCARIAEALSGDQDVVLSVNPRSSAKGATKEFPMVLDRHARLTLAAELREMAKRIELETASVEAELALALGLEPQQPDFTEPLEQLPPSAA